MKAPEIAVIGCGMGGAGQMTCEAEHEIHMAEAVIGSKRLIEPYMADKEAYGAISPEEVLNALEIIGDKKACILVSGDTGFYSLASSLPEALKGYELRYYPGVSSMASFAAKLKQSWQGWGYCSAHGRDCDVSSFVSKHRFSYVLPGGGNSPQKMLKELMQDGMGSLKCFIGEDLSYEGEKITEGIASDLSIMEFGPLAAMLIENPRADEREGSIKDESFIRGQTPMTKFAVRSLLIAKMAIKESDIVYDIGSGTGSVAIEAAVRAKRVYAIERDKEALSLMHKNIEKHAAFNVTVVEGSAPEALKGLPMPDKAFIGGSGGHMAEIIAAINEKSPGCLISAATVSLEGFSEAINAFPDADVSLVSTANSVKAGSYHLMKADNPIYLIVSGGKNG